MAARPATKTVQMILCRCGVISKQGSLWCRRCENPIVVNQQPDPRKPGESEVAHAARCGSMLVTREMIA
jgi:hypothetical protein